ncbi:unnamed protein product [Peniophora sp. CBMAI 1063]|nr:unnamed protein product [Peniophora sp. CBMAI 1063]
MRNAPISIHVSHRLNFKRFTGGSSDFPYVISLYSLELIADTTIAAASIYYLRAQASRTEITSTKHVIHAIIKYVVNTCLIEVMCIIPILALWTADASTLVYAPFVFALARVYSASVLCSLNNREHLRELFSSRRSDGDFISMPNIRAQSGTEAAPRSAGSETLAPAALAVTSKKTAVRLRMYDEDGSGPVDIDGKIAFV